MVETPTTRWPTPAPKPPVCGSLSRRPANATTLTRPGGKDERRDIVATTAALEYLQTIYEMHGDWHLALASYNWGVKAPSAARLIKTGQKVCRPIYLSLTMPNETRNYVPKLQALKNIFNSPALLAELDLPSIPNRPYFGTITKASHIDVSRCPTGKCRCRNSWHSIHRITGRSFNRKHRSSFQQTRWIPS